MAVIPKSLSALGTTIVPSVPATPSLHVALVDAVVQVVPVVLVPSDPELPELTSLQTLRKARLMRTLIPNKYLRRTNSKNIELINETGSQRVTTRK